MTADPTLDRLEAAARAATPGPWHVGDEVRRGASGPIRSHKHGHVAETGPGPRLFGDAAYIAAANPATVLALIARLRRLEAAINFRASEPGMEDHDGPSLLRLVADYMDVRDRADGNPNDTVQTDLRRWADALRALDAEPEG